MNSIFQMIYGLRYNLRSQTEFLRSSTNTSQHGLNFLRVFNSKVWNITTEIKNSATLNILKEKIKWKSKNCNYKLCLRYIQNIGYINVIWIQHQLFWKANPIKYQFPCQISCFLFFLWLIKKSRKWRHVKWSGTMTYGIDTV